MQEVWIPWRGLACAVTNVFCFFQLCGFWCELLDDDARQALLVNYILRLVLVFYLCMLNGQAVLGQFIVVSSENRQAEQDGIAMFCTPAPARAPLVAVLALGSQASRRYQHSTGDVVTAAAPCLPLRSRGTSCPLCGHPPAFRLSFCSRPFLAFLLFVNFSFKP